MRATTMIGFILGVVVGVVGTNLYRDGQLPLSETFNVSGPELVGDCKMIGATAGVRIPVYSLECFPKGAIVGAPPPANTIGEPAGGVSNPPTSSGGNTLSGSGASSSQGTPK